MCHLCDTCTSGISPRFRGLSQSLGQVTHVLLTRSPLSRTRRSLLARLACVRHAASVRPEPGSNPQINYLSVHLCLQRQYTCVFPLSICYFSYDLVRQLELLKVCLTSSYICLKSFDLSCMIFRTLFNFQCPLAVSGLPYRFHGKTISAATALLSYHRHVSLSIAFSTFFELF